MSAYVPDFLGFDIETRPRLDLVDRFTKPFPDFDLSAVKIGNLKDPEKIRAKHADARDAHEVERIEYWETKRARASLDPFTGEIVVIGVIDDKGAHTFIEGDERTILAAFWSLFIQYGQAQRRLVFWSGCGGQKKFDIDFIVTRSRILGISVPKIARDGRFYSSRIVDLAGEFLLHNSEAYLSLTRAADIFGLYEKVGLGLNPTDCARDLLIWPKRDTDAVTGANFFQWYDGEAVLPDGGQDLSPEDQRKLALHYLKNDLLHLFHIAPRIL